MNRPYSESSEQNAEVILNVIREVFTEPGHLLEIGAGTGQHAVHFSKRLDHLVWWPTDQQENIAGIEAWRHYLPSDNLKPAVALDVDQPEWPFTSMDYAYSANTAHIMSTASVNNMFKGLGRILKSGGLFCLYGPFNYNGEYTSQSNQQFDLMLRSRDPLSGIKDIVDILQFANSAGMEMTGDIEMPVNNRILKFRRS